MTWEGFNTYVGIQGIIALLFVFGYLASIFAAVALPEGFTELMTFIFGTYFTKNGRNVVNRVRLAISPKG